MHAYIQSPKAAPEDLPHSSRLPRVGRGSSRPAARERRPGPGMSCAIHTHAHAQTSLQNMLQITNRYSVMFVRAGVWE